MKPVKLTDNGSHTSGKKLPELSSYPDQLKHPVTQFLEGLCQHKNYSKLTEENYRRQLLKLLFYITKTLKLENWSQLKTIHIRQFSAYNFRNGLSARTIALILSSCRSFFNYLIVNQQLKFNPAKGVKAPKSPRKLPRTVDVDQMTALLNGIDDGDDIGIRDKAVAELFYSSGLRLAELARLNINDLDLADKSARVHGKGNKTRVVPVGQKALTAMREWLTVRSVWLNETGSKNTDLKNTGLKNTERNANRQEAIFVTRRKSRLSPRSIQKRMEYWGKFVGINGRLHPHKFRHSCATHLLESSSNLRAVQELLGHADLSTTQIYTHLDFQQLAAVYDKAHPRAKK